MLSRPTAIFAAVVLGAVAVVVVADILIARSQPLRGEQIDQPAGDDSRDNTAAESSARPRRTVRPYPSRPEFIDRFQNALTGIRLAQEVTLNNIANAETTGFKRSSVLFEDLPYTQHVLPGAPDEQGKLTPVGIQVGAGSQVAGTAVDHSEGSPLQTGRQLDVAIAGDGFFQVQDGSQIVYTRCGRFTMNADGEIVLSSADRGRLLEPAITIPQDATDVVVTSDGHVSVRQAGSQTLTQLGQILTARFINPQGLVQIGQNLFGLTDASGQPQLGTPGRDGRGTLRSGFLEASNVDLEKEQLTLHRLESHRRAIRNAMELLTSDVAAP